MFARAEFDTCSVKAVSFHGNYHGNFSSSNQQDYIFVLGSWTLKKRVSDEESCPGVIHGGEAFLRNGLYCMEFPDKLHFIRWLGRQNPKRRQTFHLFSFQQEGRSALHYAASTGTEGIVKLLLSKKADAALPGGVGFSYAVFYKLWELNVRLRGLKA